MDMNMKVQGSRNGKALGIGELLASACSASAPLDRSLISYHHTKAQDSSGNVRIIKLCQIDSCCQQ